MEGCSIIENILTNQGLRHIGDQLLGYLDYGTLLVCRQASKTWRDTLDERFSLTDKIPVINFILAFGKRNAGFGFKQDQVNRKSNRMVQRYSIKDLHEIKAALGLILNEELQHARQQSRVRRHRSRFTGEQL